MRASPLLAWFYITNKKYIKETLQTKSTTEYIKLYMKLYEELNKDSQLTHPNPELPIGGSLVLFMGLCTMQRIYSGREIIEMVQILLRDNYFEKDNIAKSAKNRFGGVIDEISKPNFSKDEFFGNLYEQMGLYRHAFNLTIYYLYTFDEQAKIMSLKDLYNKIIYEICDFGGDTDTNGAIVGMVIGPLIGISNFDINYFDVLLNFYSRERIYIQMF
jgi:ADP-ribosylglycohydrolase